MNNIASSITDGLDILDSLREKGPVLGSGANLQIPKVHEDLLKNIQEWFRNGNHKDPDLLRRVKRYLNDLARNGHPGAREILKEFF